MQIIFLGGGCLVVSNIGYKKAPVSHPAPMIIKIFKVTEWIYG